MPIENQQISDLPLLLNSEKAIVILDNDGTIFNSQFAEVWRIRAILAELDKQNIPSEEELLQIGYGKKTWSNGLITALKTLYPQLTEEHLNYLKAKLDNNEVDGLIVKMGQHMRPLPGSKHFLQEMKLNNNVVAICSDNHSDAVAEAINHHFKGIHCQLPDNRLAHKDASKPMHKPNDHIITLNDTLGHDVNKKFKPDPTKLLIQQFKALLSLNIVQENQLNEFITNSDLRAQIKEHSNYRKTVYIGDNVNDYVAAVKASFDYFVALTTTGTSNEQEFRSVINSNSSDTKVVLVKDLEFYLRVEFLV